MQSPSSHHLPPLSQLVHAGPFLYGFCENQFPLRNTHTHTQTLGVFGVGPANGGHRRGPPSSRGPKIRKMLTDFRRFSAVFDGFSSKWRIKLLPFPVLSSNTHSWPSALSKMSYISIGYVSEFSRYRGQSSIFVKVHKNALFHTKYLKYSMGRGIVPSPDLSPAGGHTFLYPTPLAPTAPQLRAFAAASTPSIPCNVSDQIPPMHISRNFSDI